MLISCVSRGAADRPQISANDVAAVFPLAVQAPGAYGFEVIFAAKFKALASETRRSAHPNLAGASWQLCSVRGRLVGGGGLTSTVTSSDGRVWGSCGDKSCDRMAPQWNSADAEWLCPSFGDLEGESGCCLAQHRTLALPGAAWSALLGSSVLISLAAVGGTLLPSA